MKIVFIGPSMPDTRRFPEYADIALRGPARRGDIAAAVLEGANVIGLVDGTFETNAAVWHKELLYALSQGVRACGASSMGALRAAECAAFGMIGIGSIYARYEAGALVDDGSVAVIHAPSELGYRPLSEPLVNVEATMQLLANMGGLQRDETAAILAAARALFFKDRTWGKILDLVPDLSGERKREIQELIGRHPRDVKREDALELIQIVSGARDERLPPPTGWQFTETAAWKQLLDEVTRRVRCVGDDHRTKSA